MNMGDSPGVPTRVNGSEMGHAACVGVLNSAAIGLTCLPGIIVGGITRVQTVFITVPDIHIRRNRAAIVIDVHQF